MLTIYSKNARSVFVLCCAVTFSEVLRKCWLRRRVGKLHWPKVLMKGWMLAVTCRVTSGDDGPQTVWQVTGQCTSCCRSPQRCVLLEVQAPWGSLPKTASGILIQPNAVQALPYPSDLKIKMYVIQYQKNPPGTKVPLFKAAQGRSGSQNTCSFTAAPLHYFTST